MKVLRGRWVLLLTGGVALAALLNAVIGFTVLKRLEKKAGAPIRGTFLPYLFLPTFRLKDPNLDWQGRFQVISGRLEVRYNPLFFLPGRRLHTWIEGENLDVRFSGELAASQGFSEVKVDHAKADLAFFEKGPPEIYLFVVDSDKLRFHLVKKEGSKSEN